MVHVPVDCTRTIVVPSGTFTVNVLGEAILVLGTPDWNTIKVPVALDSRLNGPTFAPSPEIDMVTGNAI